MRVIHETILQMQTASLSVRDFDLEKFDCPYHRHQELEILRIDESRGRVLAGDYIGIFQPGEIYVFGSRLPHAFMNTKNTRRARSRCLQFDAERIASVIEHLPETQSLTSLFQRASRGLLLSTSTVREVSPILDELHKVRGISQIAEFFRLLGTIERDEESRALASEGYSLQSPDRQLNVLETVLTYIHQNSAESLTMKHLAKLAGMSETSFYRHFRQRIGRTPNAYILDVRLSNVAQRLLESGGSISEIAFSEGFNNLSNFNHQFKSCFQLTPSAYRNRHLSAT